LILFQVRKTELPANASHITKNKTGFNRYIF